MSNSNRYTDVLAQLKAELEEHQRKVKIAQHGLDICESTIKALEQMIEYNQQEQAFLNEVEKEQDDHAGKDLHVSTPKDSEFRYPNRRLTQRIVDVLFYIGKTGATREDAAEFAEKTSGTKQASTKSMLQTNARKYGFVEQIGAGYYQLTERGAKYLEDMGYTPSPEVEEARDVAASRASENTHSPDELRAWFEDLQDLKED